jgi:3-oxoacyl-[acyl-carrier protein] reductase
VRALVTGASLGIGRATALRLGRAGFDVLVHYRSHPRDADAVAAELRAMGRKAWTVRADLALPEEVESLAQQVLVSEEPLDALVHNAGEYPRTSLEDLAPDLVRTTFQVHVFAPLELTRRCRPALVRASPGRVVFVSSVLAFQGSGKGADYSAAKAAAIGLARALSRELAPGVLVNVVAPGSIDTAILSGDSPERRAERERTIPLRRIGTADEVAEAVAFLASSSASYVTGATLHVNGGLRPE